MAGFGTTFRNDVWKAIFHGTPIANLLDNAASSPLTNLYVAWHTADPGTGDQTTSEASYTGYVRKAVARTSGGWTITGNVVNPVADVDGGECTGSAGAVITHWSIGFLSSGAGKIIGSGALASSHTVAVGDVPRVKSTSTITLT